MMSRNESCVLSRKKRQNLKFQLGGVQRTTFQKSIAQCLPQVFEALFCKKAKYGNFTPHIESLHLYDCVGPAYKSRYL